LEGKAVAAAASTETAGAVPAERTGNRRKGEKPMIDFLQYVALAIWIAAGVYCLITTRRLNKRCDRILGEFEAELHGNGGPGA